jgi:beta-phosphoglucomutase-like phosphatase (HAD superfamily)
MRLTGLDKVFRAVVYGDDIPHGKPAPDIYLEAARRLGVPPKRCLGIEDSGNGVRALHNAGMLIVAAPTTDFPLPPDLLALAQATITSLEAFTPALVASLSR